MSDKGQALLQSTAAATLSAYLPQAYDSAGDTWRSAKGDTSGNILMRQVSQVPYGASFFCQTTTATANATAVATVVSAAATSHYILGFCADIFGAASTSDIMVTIKDSSTIKLTRVIGAGSPVGSGVDLAAGAPIVVGTAAAEVSINASPGGTGCACAVTIWGYSL